MALTVLLADDHPIVRQGLRAVLGTEPDIELVGEASDGTSAVKLAAQLKPAVVVLDLMLPGTSGLEAARQLRKRMPDVRIVILSMHSDPAYVREAMRAGVDAYVAKEAGGDELIQAVRAAAEGRRYLSPPITEDVLSGRSNKDPFDLLTAREREVLQLTAEGLTGNDVAERLFISPRTVESHRANMMRKFGLRNQKELIRFAVERKLVK
jgi:DNA-binding NarL/FixJ family response regulator